MHHTSHSLKKLNKERERETHTEVFSPVTINAVERNQLDLNTVGFFFYYKDISLSYNFLRCLTFGNLEGKKAWVHTHAGALSDLARIKEAFESIRK